MSSTNQTTEQQRQTWNKFSGGWEKWDEWVINWLAPIGSELLDQAEIKPTDRVLDVSTGTGEPGLTAATRAAQVVATDVAEDMVEIAGKNAQTRELKNFEAKVADAESLPFSDGEFDSIVCRLGVMYFANPTAGVKEMARVLKPGGKMALAAWSEPAKNPWATTAAGTINKLLDLPAPPPDTPGVFRCSQPELLSQFLEQADLKDIRQVEVIGESIFDSPEHYWEFVMDVVAPVATPLSNADDQTRERAKQAVIEATKPFQKDDKVVFPYACWVASGQK
ncbi:MAG: methyltransferase domain-containing protein [bacterium]|nr:methyltransferase domain-containing protein [bacterium]MDZ4248086.1 methyltransferase domain-containing protein [Patescibacteria group bacterium]